MQPQPLAVLHCLAEHAGRLVTREDLLKQAWPGTRVSKTALKVCVHAIRAALGDDAAAPRYVETVGRLGYRFLCAENARETDADAGGAGAPRVVARGQELDRLRQWLAQVHRGSRRVVFVTGEPGIGKTTLVDLFVADLEARGHARLGRGQCLDQYGAGEAYLPVLEALGQLCRGPAGRQVLDVLCRCAPTWVVQMPAQLTEAALEGLQRKVAGATRARMLREMAEALESLTAEQSLVLVFEDLHWSDRSTLDLIAYLARRREPARLMVIGTYRSADLVIRSRPLKGIKQELQAHGHCVEIALELLTEEDVAAYVAGWFGESGAPPDLAREVYQRSGGNPLFMVHLVDHYRRHAVMDAEQHGLGDPDDVPESLHQVIEQQIATLPADVRQALEVASVVGMEFAVAQIAAALDRHPDALEDVCDELAHAGRFLREVGVATWPDGTVTGRYGFRHALYQNVLYRRLTDARRARLHRVIGERAEAAFGERAGELAAALAVHFERGCDLRRAVRYLRQAGENAVRRSAHHEAIAHFTRGLELLDTWPGSPERDHEELTLQLAVGAASMAAKGYAAPQVEVAYGRASTLSERLGDTPQLFKAMAGMRGVVFMRGRLETARELGEGMLTLAGRSNVPVHLLQAHYALGETSLFLGDLPRARMHMEQGLALSDPRKHNPGTLQDPRVACLGRAAAILACLGYLDQGRDRALEAIALARELSHPFSLAYARMATAWWCHQLRGDRLATRAEAEALITLSTGQGFPVFLQLGIMLRGWALAAEGEADHIRRAIRDHRDSGAEAGLSTHLALLADAYRAVNRPDDGLSAVAEALAFAHTTGERFLEAELYRLKGELLLQRARRRPGVPTARGRPGHVVRAPRIDTRGAESLAETCFVEAMAIARRQEAKTLELRAGSSLARLWRRRGRKTQARQMLTQVYEWFSEGFDAGDLVEARALLDELS